MKITKFQIKLWILFSLMTVLSCFCIGCKAKVGENKTTAMENGCELPEPSAISISHCGEKQSLDSSFEEYREIWTEIQENWGKNESGKKEEAPLHLMSCLNSEQADFSRIPLVICLEYDTPIFLRPKEGLGKTDAIVFFHAV